MISRLLKIWVSPIRDEQSEQGLFAKVWTAGALGGHHTAALR